MYVAFVMDYFRPHLGYLVRVRVSPVWVSGSFRVYGNWAHVPVLNRAIYSDPALADQRDKA